MADLRDFEAVHTAVSVKEYVFSGEDHSDGTDAVFFRLPPGENIINDVLDARFQRVVLPPFSLFCSPFSI